MYYSWFPLSLVNALEYASRPLSTDRGFWVMPYLAKLSEEQRQKAYAEVLELIGDRVITPYTGKVFPLVEFWDAIAEATKPARGGKAFLSE